MENTIKAAAAKAAKSVYARPELKTFGSVQKLTGWPSLPSCLGGGPHGKGPGGPHDGGPHGPGGSSIGF